MLQFVKWYEASSFGVAVENSNWVFPLAEAIHLLALAMLLGIVTIVSLRLLGLVLRDEAAGPLAAFFRGYFWRAVSVMLGTGFVMFWCNAYKYYHSPSFHVKLIVLIAAIVFQAVLLPRITISDAVGKTTALARLAGIVSLALWFGVGLAGRAIGFLG